MNIIPLNLQKAVGLSRLSNKSMELQKSADRSINEIKMTISVLFVEVKISNTNIGPFPDLLSELLPTRANLVILLTSECTNSYEV